MGRRTGLASKVKITRLQLALRKVGADKGGNISSS
jgi:hypothetical protein